MSIIEEAEEYLLNERAKRGYYTDSVEVLDIVEDLIDELEKANKVVEAAKEFNEIDYRYTTPEEFAEIREKLSEALSEVKP